MLPSNLCYDFIEQSSSAICKKGKDIQITNFRSYHKVFKFQVGFWREAAKP